MSFTDKVLKKIKKDLKKYTKGKNLTAFSMVLKACKQRGGKV